MTPGQIDAIIGNALLDIKTRPRLWPRNACKSEAVFCFERQGYDPRNHHGRYMHPLVIQGHEIKHSLIIIDDFSVSYDPRNHTGAKL